jgi:hypothetical protein
LQQRDPNIEIETRQTRLLGALLGANAKAAASDPQAPPWS